MNLLVFRLGQTWLAIPIRRFLDVADMQSPEAAARRSHGEAPVPVLDLRPQLVIESAEDAEKYYLMVVEVQRGNETAAMGIVVDRVARIVEVPDNGAGPTAGVAPVRARDLQANLIHEDGRCLTFLDPEECLTHSTCSARSAAAEDC